MVAVWNGFEKKHRLDLIVDNMVYELKAIDALGPEHDAQVFHYAALLETDRIKLVNFGGPQVEGALRRTPFAELDRRDLTMDTSRFDEKTPQCGTLVEATQSILLDWGRFLSPPCYTEALVHHLGGQTACVKQLPVTHDNVFLGHHTVHGHGPDVAFSITACSDPENNYESHLQRRLSSLPLAAWQWVNIDQDTVRFITLSK